jgi:hypothetical protein
MNRRALSGVSGSAPGAYIRFVMTRFSTIALAATFVGLVAEPVAAQQADDPDWPCQQRKVPELSAASVWSGPAVDAAEKLWQEDGAVAALVSQLASRRVPAEEATAAISKFAQGLKPEEKAAKLTLVFAGAFVSLDRERGEIMDGIDRYARRQKEIAEQIRQGQSRLSDLNSAGNDPQQVSDLTGQLQTQVRLFNERRSSLTYVCEVPTLIEQRLFTLAKAIQAEIPS